MTSSSGSQEAAPGEILIASSAVAPSYSDVARLRNLGKRRLFVARRDGKWGIAGRSIEWLQSIYEGDHYDAIYRIDRNFFEDRRRTPDIVLTRVDSAPPPTPEQEEGR